MQKLTNQIAQVLLRKCQTPQMNPYYTHANQENHKKKEKQAKQISLTPKKTEIFHLKYYK